MGDLRATFLADLARKLFFDVIFLFGVCGSQGLYNSSRRRGSRTKNATLIIATGARTTPLIEIPPLQTPLLETPQKKLGRSFCFRLGL